MKIVVLTGAGISKESGIPTFRDCKSGLWENHKIEEVASPKGFMNNPTMVQDFYNQRRIQAKGVHPNAAHFALAELAKHHEVQIVTQNVDDLHERAGSKDVIHLHGSLFRMRCMQCGHKFEHHDAWYHEDICPKCGTSRAVRPDIVWFGECLAENDWSWSVYHTEQADLFVQIGTSAEVYPANVLRHNAKRAKIEINIETDSRIFSHTYEGPATIQVNQFVKDVLEGKYEAYQRKNS